MYHKKHEYTHAFMGLHNSIHRILYSHRHVCVVSKGNLNVGIAITTLTPTGVTPVTGLSQLAMVIIAIAVVVTTVLLLVVVVGLVFVMVAVLYRRQCREHVHHLKNTNSTPTHF